jgi:tetratricopeptide (TPR) repeat protein/tRNA A-37 threonylcarbamoyl transferase component Bud32/TolB-like protein
MHLSGLTDSPLGPIDAHNQCGCGSVIRLRSGVCGSCLLRDSLQGELLDDIGFERELAGINVPDRDWRLGNYQILEEVDRGGMGVVYRARHLASRRIVALKRVLTYHSDSQQTLARFQREAQAAASLDHPNILPIYDVGTTDDGLPYFTMKFAAGGSLLNARGFFQDDLRRCAELILKVAGAIDYAHRHGVIHRDLKPGNILLDAQGEPMLADFGLAKWLDTGSNLTCSLTVFGTPGYIAPEQAEAPRACLTAAVDVYSLGAIFFELLSGRPPFLGEHAIGIIRQAADQPAPRLRSVSPNLPRDLETICARCLEREPSARYGSAGDLALDIGRWLENRPIVARRLSPPARFWRWSRRNRGLTMTLSACIALATAAAVWRVEDFRLGKAIYAEAIATHSVVVLPFLNLDEGTPDAHLAQIVADSLRTQMSGFGAARVVLPSHLPAKWTGAGTSAEVRQALKESDCRKALIGMFRQTDQGIRLSLRLAADDASHASQNWAVEISDNNEAEVGTDNVPLARSIYHVLDSHALPAPKTDPDMSTPTAEKYIDAGRSLLERRTIPDMDRSIRCFEEAIQAAPRSVAARSYLALALVGRNFLSADPAYIDRAYKIAKEALQISPDDPSAHRALCALDTFTGHFDEALENGLRALELGDPSERAIGQIAYAWKKLGRPDRAIEWFTKAKASEKQLADYDAILGDAWLLLGEDDKALEAYQTSSNFRPELPEGWLGISQIKLLQGDFSQARALFEKHAAEYSAFHSTKSFQAQLEFFARNFPEAEQLYSEILRADPHGAEAEQYGAVSSMSALARLKLETGDRNTAMELLENCIANDQSELMKSPRHPEVLYRLAADEAIKGDAVSALAYLRQSVAAGFIDYRCMRIDPRFDGLISNPEFQKITFKLSAHVAALRQRAKTTNLETNK